MVVSIWDDSPAGKSEVDNIDRFGVDIPDNRRSLEMQQVRRKDLYEKAMLGLDASETIDQHKFRQIVPSSSWIFDSILWCDVLACQLDLVHSCDDVGLFEDNSERVVGPVAAIPYLVDKADRRIVVRKGGSPPAGLVVSMIVQYNFEVKRQIGRALKCS
jgi:hypothetical protein